MSTKISTDEVKKMAALGRISLTEEEAKDAAGKLSSILEYFSLLQKIDTKDVPTYDNATNLTNVSRADQAKPEALSSHQELLKAIPHVEKKQAKVPGVLKS